MSGIATEELTQLKLVRLGCVPLKIQGKELEFVAAIDELKSFLGLHRHPERQRLTLKCLDRDTFKADDALGEACLLQSLHPHVIQETP